MARNITIHRSCIRHTTLLGGDRELIMIGGLVAVACIFVLQTTYAIVFGFALWFFVLFASRLMIKADVLMKKIYLKHIKYQKFYSAKPTPFEKIN